MRLAQPTNFIKLWEMKSPEKYQFRKFISVSYNRLNLYDCRANSSSFIKTLERPVARKFTLLASTTSYWHYKTIQ